MLLFGLCGAGLSGCLGEPGEEPLVVYCAHDSLYSEQILREFEAQTGIDVAPRFDTEATKSLGLVNLLIQEKEHPRCDVFWNNQVLGTMQLVEHDLLQPYKGPGWERIPKGFKDPQGRWTGFAARLRVYVINTENMPATEEAVEKALADDDLSRMAIAKPLYGTTLTHYSLLWHLWGGETLKGWHRDVRERGLREVPGNATVKNLVAEGVCDFGWTDTDDFYLAKDDGKPVEMVPVRVPLAKGDPRGSAAKGDSSPPPLNPPLQRGEGENGATICIPNSVAIIKGTDKPEQARKLVEFLLSKQTELRLAESRARQIPLGPVEEAELPEDVRPLKTWAEEGHDLMPLDQARKECLDWLKSEYLQ